ncbi:MAG: hypothetical protein LBJ72_05945 [Dysgonamonadaceae bacterium]|jgi:hypothetical protein|nr:hypothetical protein [Dysgonamonadaceae bacterium]
MNPKKVVEPLLNSAGEILPLILLLVASFYVPLGVAFAVGIASYFLYLLLTLLITKQMPSFILRVSGILLIIAFTLFAFSLFETITPEFLVVVSEILLVVIFSIAVMLKDFFIEKAKNKRDKKQRATFLIRINETFLITHILRNTLVIHLIIVLLYKTLPEQFHPSIATKIIIPDLLLVSILLIYIFEIIRILIMTRKINTENWLPIVNETGGVIGKVALSVSLVSNKPYLHPVVRIVLIYKGLFYLCERPEHYVINSGKIDYPFEKYVFYNHSLDEAVSNAFQKVIGRRDLPVKFVLRYLFKNDTANRLVYLYTCKINDEEMMNKINLTKGKLWTEKQIEENLGKYIFSECFEKEYEILKNTVLMAEKIISGEDIIPG